MRLRAWTCTKCNKLIITGITTQGIGCKCGVMLRKDIESTRKIVEWECKDKAEIYNIDIDYYRKKSAFVVPKQYEIDTVKLLKLLVENAIEIEFKDVF
jgi:hypothetical protein